MRKLLGIWGLILSWFDGLTGIFFTVFMISKASSKYAIMAYMGTLYPSGMKFKRDVLSTEAGKKLLNERTCRLESVLSNMNYLAALPVGTLGRTYHDFIRDEVKAKLDHTDYLDFHTIKRNFFFSPKEIRKRELISKLYPSTTAREAHREAKTTVRLTEQIALQHDVMHCLMGYTTDAYGEIGVHVFQIPHVHIPAIKLIGILGTISQTVRTCNLKAFHIAREAYRISKKSTQSLFTIDWADYVDVQITDIRKRYNIDDNVYYQKTR